jgi:hypothetical protein
MQGCIADLSRSIGMRLLLPMWRVTPTALRGSGR